jgi:hypothetical protein
LFSSLSSPFGILTQEDEEEEWVVEKFCCFHKFLDLQVAADDMVSFCSPCWSLVRNFVRVFYLFIWVGGLGNLTVKEILDLEM